MKKLTILMLAACVLGICTGCDGEEASGFSQRDLSLTAGRNTMKMYGGLPKNMVSGR